MELGYKWCFQTKSIFDTNLFLHVFHDQCIISYGGGGVAGFYAVALQVEDFLNNERLSSVPVQFLVNLFDSPADCGSANPLLVGETPQDGDCISIAPGGTFEASVVARVRINGSR